MAIKYSQKTAISLYKFDNEDEYRIWLNANSKKTDCQDIVAIVKDEKMNNGLDLFVNGHSLTKTKIYIKKKDSVVEVSDSKELFNPNKQYYIKNFSRRGLGQKNILVLEEIDLNEIISDKIDNFKDNSLPSIMNDYMENYLDDYFESHPIQAETADVKKFEKILTNTHYMFRKIFSLLYKERAIHLGLSVKYFDENNTAINPFVEYKETKTIKKAQFRITGATGKDVVFKNLSFYEDNSETPFLTVNGTKLQNGINEDVFMNVEISKNKTIHAILTYDINRLIDTAKSNNISNFDSSVFFKNKEEKCCCCSKFFIVEPKIELSAYELFFGPNSSSQMIQVSANNDWTISNTNSWVVTEIQNGIVKISVQENTKTTNREGEIVFNIQGGEPKTLKITQGKVNAQMSIEPSSLSFVADGGSKTLTIESNYAWNVDENSSWIDLVVEDNLVTVNVDKNPTSSRRTASVRFESDSLIKTVSVTQDGSPKEKIFDKSYLIFVPTEYDENGYTKLLSPFDEISNFETIRMMTSLQTSEIEFIECETEYGVKDNYEFPFNVPNKYENYQIYVLVPLRDVDITNMSESSSPIKLSASNFDDNISERCDVDTYNNMEYLLVKQSFAQGANQSFIFKLTTK